MDRWLRPGSRGGADGREREGGPAGGRAGGMRSPVRSSRDQGKLLWTKQSGAAADELVLGTGDKASSSNQENVPKRASFRTSSLPMKVLKENQMTKEEDRRSKSPSVIARLMGLDLSSAKPAADKQKNVLENGIIETRKTLKFDKYRDQPVDKVSFKQKRNDREGKFPRQNQTRENQSSGDENLRCSKETGHGLNAFDFNKDFILRFLRGHPPLLSNHLEDTNSHSSTTKPSHITILRPGKGTKHRGEFSTLEVPGKEENGMHRNGVILHEGFGSGSESIVRNSVREQLLPEQKLRKLRVVRKHEPCIHPAHIVILKPNLKNLQDKEKLLSRCTSTGNFHGSQREHSCTYGVGTMFAQVDNPEKMKYEVLQMDEPSEICRGIAVKAENMPIEIGKQLYNDLTCFQQNESSQSESDFYYIDDEKTCQPMSMHSSKSSITKQGKKHNAEQWVTSQKSQDAGLLGPGAISAPILEMENRNLLGAEDRKGNVLPSVRSKDGDGRHLHSQSIDGAAVHSDSYLRKLPRRRSLSIPSSVSENNSLQNFYINGEKYLHPRRGESGRPFPNVATINDRQSVKLDSNRDVTKPPISSGSVASARLLRTNVSTINKIVDSKPSTGVTNDAKTLDVDAQRYRLEVRENTFSAATVIADLYDTNDHKPECSSPMKEVSSIPCLPNLSRLSSNSRKPHLIIKLEDAENCSPVSVLESAEERDPISPECFSDLNADLNELRLQLDLLKLETPKSRAEAPQLVCDESNLEDDNVPPQEEDGLQFCTDEEERDFSYLLGILTDSHLGGITMDMIFSACYSLESPVDPNVFEKLEKVFDEPEVWSRAERKLLFDLANSVLSEELAPNIDLHPWVQPCRIAGLVRRRRVLAEDVWKSLVRKRKELEVRPAKPIPDVSWLDVRDDIDMIGRDIEKMLRDELLDEIVIELIAV